MRGAMREGEINMKIVHPNDEIVIYGAGECGVTMLSIFKNAGYQVKGFIDMKKRGELCGLPIVKIKDKLFRRDSIVFVALSNGNLHKAVVEALFEEGYQYIISLSLGFHLSSSLKSRITRNYSDISCGELQTMSAFEPEDYKEDYLEEQKKFLEAWEENKLRLIWISKNIVFSELKEGYPGDINRLPDNSDLFDFPVALRKPYYVLYEYFEGKTENVNGYFDIYRDEITQEKKNAILAERYELFRIMKKEIQSGNMAFFENCAPVAQWNKKGHFNLVGGHHRITFLIYQGMESVPVLVQKQDYISWCNLERVLCYKDILSEGENVISFHLPFFSSKVSKYQAYEQKVYDAVLEEMWRFKNDGYSVMDMSAWNGMFALIAKRLRYGDIVVYASDKAYVKAVFDILGVTDISFLPDCRKTYDIVFDIDGEQCQNGKKNNKQYFMDLRKYCKHYLFADFVRQEMDSKRAMQLGLFESVSLLCTIYKSGQMYDIYLFKYKEG